MAIAAVVYDWREGARFRADPQEVGEELDRIAGEMRRELGAIDEADVLASASDPESPLHTLFEWDDSVAAEKYRLEQARNVIRSIRIVRTTDAGTTPVRCRVVVRDGGGSRVYVPVDVAAQRDDLRRQMIADAVTGLKGWMSRYSDLAGREGVGEAFDLIERGRAILEQAG